MRLAHEKCAHQVIFKIPDMSQMDNMSLRVFEDYFPLIFPPAYLKSYPSRSLSPATALQSSQLPSCLNKERILRKVHCLLSIKTLRLEGKYRKGDSP